MEKFYTFVSYNTYDSHKKFVQQLIQRGATEVDSPDKSDVIIVFCPIVRHIGTDITAALSNMSDLSGSKPVILVVMHHTFNPDFNVPDSSRLVNNSSVRLVVDCLFHETKGLLECPRNENAVREVLRKMDLPKYTSRTWSFSSFSFLWDNNEPKKEEDSEVVALRRTHKKRKNLQIELNKLRRELQDKDEQLKKLQPETKGKLEEEKNQQTEQQGKTTMEKFYTHVTGNTFESHKKFLQQLIEKGATEVDSPDKSDVIIVFCPIVRRLGTDITAALSNMSELSGSKPVILVVMHHIFNPDYNVSDSSRLVNNSSVKLVVDCLFHETRGLLESRRNENAVSQVLKQMEAVPNTSSLPLPSCTRCTQMEALLVKKDQQVKDKEHELELTRDNLREREKKILELEVERNDMSEVIVKLREELQSKDEQLQKLSRTLQDRNEDFEKSGQMKKEESNSQPEQQGGGQQLSVAPLQL